MLNCPQCDTPLGYTVMDDKEDPTYTHLIEICVYCGYTKSFVDYTDEE